MDNRAVKIGVFVAIAAFGVLIVYHTMNSGEDDATAVANQFYSCVMTDDLETASTLFHSLATRLDREGDIASMLKDVEADCGSITNYTISTRNVRTNIGSGGIVTQIDLAINVTRTKYNSEESMILVKRNFEPFRIVIYNVDSEAYDQPDQI